MVNYLRAALIVGTGALAYKVLTKEKLVTDKNVTNGTIGAVAGMIGVPKLENIVKADAGKNSKTGRNVLIGTALGAAGGYWFSDGRSEKAAEKIRKTYDKYLSPDEKPAYSEEEAED